MRNVNRFYQPEAAAWLGEEPGTRSRPSPAIAANGEMATISPATFMRLMRLQAAQVVDHQGVDEELAQDLADVVQKMLVDEVLVELGSGLPVLDKSSLTTAQN